MIASSPSEPLLRTHGLAKSYVQRRAFTREKFSVRAFADVELSVSRGTTLAIVGESGAGKSSLARCLALLEKPDRGEVWLDGANATQLSRRDLNALRRKVQLIFQDSTAALNSRFSAVEVVGEPLLIQGTLTESQRRDRAIELMRQVGLPSESAGKRAFEFSGGQRQRLAIARALALEPSLLILDEALSNLDLANQQMVLALLDELQQRLALTYIHVTHDLRLVSQVADEVAVMLDGKIVERASSAEIFANPKDGYTKQLLRAMPPLNEILQKRLREAVA